MERKPENDYGKDNLSIKGTADRVMCGIEGELSDQEEMAALPRKKKRENLKSNDHLSWVIYNALEE